MQENKNTVNTEEAQAAAEKTEKTKIGHTIAELKEKLLKNRRKRLYKKLIAVFAVVFALLLCYGIDVYHEVYNLNIKDDVTVVLNGGESIDQVAEMLGEAGAVKHKNIFKLIAKSKGLDSGFGTGEYKLEPGMRYTQVLRMMRTTYSEQQVTLTEGLTKKEIFERLAKTGYVTVQELEAAEKRGFSYDFLSGIERENMLEGYLFPETYSFSNEQTPKEMLDVMLTQFDSVFNEEYKARAAELGMSVDEVVILASVIEGEASDLENMKKVSSVFHNRLNNGDKLQSCATVQYLLGERKPILSSEDIRIDSPYNTYIYSGLPYGPICSPSKAAIEAALYPADTEYYYFQSDLSGNLYFSVSFADHEETRKRIQGE